ncbi:VTT domain-containing protein [Methylobacillus flagellatus]|uniref:Phospholipase D/Transphosphatidylase n=1 Tax=Methylobacillus flagellatus (strain ATCC 51484 / DSM 6875 / VKM B-1610 / KT) TaxID=265072 RepID=Q1H1E8_METFK|nr:VTT domain-containing protein [Methylobacillus flagellatus]ABE49689.1 phospholipase D/Transphosphatidylase [Methylobacillus flagellatus KT]
MPSNQASSVSPESALFRVGHNCWKHSHASYMAPVIDCANYYRALHEAICRAQHSIFILGWDIDSRIELIRGSEAEARACPTALFELLQWKARQTPDIQVYLNRWNYSVFLSAERESFSEAKWALSGADNLHFIFDGQLPLGASHHQKIVVIDDEVAFCGGMDVAIARWDNRHHRPRNPHRADPDGSLKLGMEKRFDPYHDVQMLVAGPVAAVLARLVRYRWHFGGGKRAVKRRRVDPKAWPPSWPACIKPVMEDVSVAVSLTMPRFHRQPQIQQIERLYLDMIAQAEYFIYMENQFFTHRGIAKALNQRLRENPRLKVLLVSCYDAQGVMERKALFHARLIFRTIVESHGVADRVVLAYPASAEHGEEAPVRIHSKLMVVDDRYLRIGSSNINNRSMALDSECDLVIEAKSALQRKQIADIRNDLIREHTGLELEEIERIARQVGAPVAAFLAELEHSRQHLRRINDDQYRHERFTRLARRFADPSRPILPGIFTSRRVFGARRRRIPFRLIAGIALVAAVALSWKVTPLAEYADPEKIIPLLEQVQNTAWAFPAGLVAYVLGTLVFLPHMVMTGTVVVVFAPLEAFLIAMLGSLISVSIGWVAGQGLGERSLQAMLGRHAEKISQYARNGGVMGLTLLRLLPVAPFTVVNLVLGMMKVPFVTLLIATALGLLPGTLVSVFIGQSAVALFKNPDPHNVMLVGAGLLLWGAVIAGAHFLSRHWQRRLRENK